MERRRLAAVAPETRALRLWADQALHLCERMLAGALIADAVGVGNLFWINARHRIDFRSFRPALWAEPR
jgi:hypothetical protein